MTRAIILATTLLLAASAARASDWPGTWRVDGGGERTIVEQGPLVTLDVEANDLSYHLVGAPNGHKLHLEGRPPSSPGFVGALGRAKTDPSKHKAVLDATLDDSVAKATITIDGSSHEETWRQGSLEVVELLSDDRPLAGAFDAKRSKSGLVVRYRVNGSSMKVTFRVEVLGGHPYASFYEKPVIHERDLGSQEAGEHEVTWDGRDSTEAKRIALGGPYRVVVASGAVEGDRSFSVNPPRFEGIGSDWPEDRDHSAWNPHDHIQDLAAMLLTSLDTAHPGAPGFDFEGPRIVTDTTDVKKRASEAGALLLTTHGSVGALTVHDGSGAVPYDPAALFGHDLKDCHVAIVSACYSGRSDEKVSSVCDQLVAAGCDVVVGFSMTVRIGEADAFEQGMIALMSMGCAIDKAAEDAAVFAKNATTLEPAPGTARPKDCLVRRFGKGILPRESLWPPRYGNSRN